MQSEHNSDFQRLVEEELQRLQIRSSLAEGLDHAQFVIGRVIVRGLRICAGVVGFFLALWLFEYVSDIADKPLAALTLRDLAASVAAVIGGAWIAFVSFKAAFGTADARLSLRERAEKSVRERLNQQAVARQVSEQIGQAAAAKQVASATWYRHGRMIGALFDPELTKRKPWLAALVLVVGVVVIGLVVLALANHR